GQLEALAGPDGFAPQRVLDRTAADACRAGLWLYHDFLDESHALSQEIHTTEGSYWHVLAQMPETSCPNELVGITHAIPHGTFLHSICTSDHLTLTGTCSRTCFGVSNRSRLGESPWLLRSIRPQQVGGVADRLAARAFGRRLLGSTAAGAALASYAPRRKRRARGVSAERSRRDFDERWRSARARAAHPGREVLADRVRMIFLHEV